MYHNVEQLNVALEVEGESLYSLYPNFRPEIKHHSGLC